MSYSLNGKIYTQHALMDEIVYNTKLILHGIRLKNATKANEYETENSVDDSELFLSILNGKTTIRNLPLTASWLASHDFTSKETERYLDDPTKLPDYVECKFQPYDENIPDNSDFKVSWNSEYARFEYPDGTIAGINKNTPVYYNQKEKKFYYTKTKKVVPDDAHIIGFKEPYYVDTSDKITFYDPDTDSYTNYAGDHVGVATYCIAGACREYANDYYNNEENNYYRTLMGLPEYGTHKYDILWTKALNDQYADKLKEAALDLPINVPIHEFTSKQINTIDALGILDEIKYNYRENQQFRNTTKIQKHRTYTEYVSDVEMNKWKYLDYLGSKKIDLYLARSAKDWDIIYMPHCENLVENRFKELYKINRDIYFNQTFQLAYQYRSDYFEEMMMFITLCQTFADMITDTPEWYIRRDIFDLRSVQYFLESNGVKFFEDIPLRYQILIVKNLNKLIKYKSTDKNIKDILSIFNAEGTNIYEYYIFKKYLYTKENTNDVTTNSEDATNWSILKGWIKNGDFETGNTSQWTIDYEGKGNRPKVDGDAAGYYLVKDSSSPSNSTYTLQAWNYNIASKEFTLKQTVKNLPIGSYKVRFKYSGDCNYTFSSIHLYANNESIYTFDRTQGEDDWRVVYSSSFEVNSPQDIEFKFSGYIPTGNTIELDDIELYEYTEIYECGDMEDDSIDWTKADNFVFLDENTEFDLNPHEIEMYDFGDDNETDIKSSEASDIEEENRESQKIITDSAGNVYELEFVKVPIGESYDDYIKDQINRVTYDSVTRQDKYWDGEDVHSYVRNQHLRKDFTIEGTKYMAIQDDVSLSEYNYEKEYYLGMLFSSTINTDSITIPIPEIKEDTYFRLKDIFIFLYCLNGLYTNTAVDVNILGDWYGRNENKPKYTPYTNLDAGKYNSIDFVQRTITKDNYTNYLESYVIDINTGLCVLLTKDNYTDFLGKQYIIYDTFADGHYLMQDEENKDLKFNVDGAVFTRADGGTIKGDPEVISESWRNNYDGGKLKYTYGIPSELYYDWLRGKYPYFWIPLNGRIYGFNPDVSKEELSADIGVRHSKFGWSKGFTLADCGCDTFIFNKRNFASTSEMQSVYEANTKCYKALIKKIENAETRDERQVYTYVYYKLFTIPYTTDFYRLKDGSMATDYVQILKEADYTLYSKYNELAGQSDESLKTSLIRDLLNNLVDTLSYYINSDNLKYVLSFVYTNNFDSIMHYISLLVNFFKSWKVYFLDPRAIYHVDDKYNNQVYSGDTVEEIKPSQWTVENSKVRDSVEVRPKYYIEEGSKTYNKNWTAEVIDIYSHYEDNNIFKDRNYDGTDPSVKSLNPTGSAIDESNCIAILNGGGVSVASRSPYFVENGGRVTGRIDVYHLDCGGAGLLSASQFKEASDKGVKLYDLPSPDMADGCVEVDGGNLADYFGELGTGESKVYTLKYDEEEMTANLARYNIVDGGAPNNRQVYTPTAITHLTDYNEVSVDGRASANMNPDPNTNINGFMVGSDQSIGEVSEIWPVRDMIDFNLYPPQDRPNEKVYDLDFGDEETTDVEGERHRPYETIYMYDFDAPQDYGFFFPTSNYVTKKDSDNLKKQVDDLYNTIGETIKHYYDLLMIFGDMNKVAAYIDSYYANTFAVALEMISTFLGSDTFYKSIQKEVDDRIQAFNDWYDNEADPFPVFIHIYDKSETQS